MPRQLPALVAMITWAAACAEPAPTNTCQPVRTRQAIVGGSETEARLSLAPQERAALVYLSGSVDGEPALCSGTVVAEGWVLTAAHCEPIVLDATHKLGNAQGELGFAEAHYRHPTLDLMLLHASASPTDAAALAWSSTDETVDVGDVAALAGYGFDRSRTGVLQFVDAMVTARDDTAISVEGIGAAGACDGDSGGPLLQRGSNRGLVVLGVLSSGSQSCTGTDVYTRTDVADAWLRGYVGNPPRPFKGPFKSPCDGGCTEPMDDAACTQ